MGNFREIQQLQDVRTVELGRACVDKIRLYCNLPFVKWLV